MVNGMSEREKGMARLLSRPSRGTKYDAVIERISPGALTILDLGCGIGALTTSLVERFPSALIVGVDRSKFLLNKLQKKGNALTVLADISAPPLKDGFFDVAIAVQVLHEILSSEGTHILVKTLQNIRSLLCKGGEFVILDHISPGDAPVLLRLSEELSKRLCEFQSKFKHRKITFEKHDKELIRISMRDFYDFLTKIWALNSDLEEEEMNETHTPFTRQELEVFLQKAGFEVEQTVSRTPVRPRKGIKLQSKVKLPNREIIVLAKAET
jgi:SAM-dependent methyltransferase